MDEQRQEEKASESPAELTLVMMAARLAALERTVLGQLGPEDQKRYQAQLREELRRVQRLRSSGG